MNTYATITNELNNKTTRVLVRNGAINSRQCNDALTRVSMGVNRFRVNASIPINVLDSDVWITPKGIQLKPSLIEHTIQNPDKKYTVAYVINDEQPGSLEIKYATALTAPRDNFSRKLGRTIAMGRLNSGKPETTSTIRVPGRIPTNGKEWQVLETTIRRVVESKHRRKG